MNQAFMEKTVRITFKEKKIALSLHVPENPEYRVPAVLFCHGYTGSRIEQRYIFVRMARLLAKAGIASLRFDYRGCGESEGLFRDHSLLNYIEDTEFCLEYMKNLDSIINEKIGILGYSLGGAVAAETTEKHPEIKTVVLWSPVADPMELFIKRKENSESLQTDKIKKYIEHDGWEIGFSFINSLGKVKPVKKLGKYPGPVLLCHGEKDLVVDPKHTRDYELERSKVKGKTKIIFFPESGHGYKPLEEDKMLLENTRSWFLKHL
jgi:uncharacterized protein